jgi:hypothetical protein
MNKPKIFISHTKTEAALAGLIQERLMSFQLLLIHCNSEIIPKTSLWPMDILPLTVTSVGVFYWKFKL